MPDPDQRTEEEMLDMLRDQRGDGHLLTKAGRAIAPQMNTLFAKMADDIAKSNKQD